ncbi:rhodanese-like domain-containing protein [Mesoflavibacter sp. CH_XMU1404-2]|uniref:rhodanese-like domain-containing protein n=1 Tax=Mesoflavibacter sp. CH_XMU1404-2 TaxID=3107766 RepID=UPI003009774D
MKTVFLYIFVLIGFQSFAQKTLDDVLKKHNRSDIPYISVQELAMPKTKAKILDARSVEEYNISHLKNAFFVGFENFNLKKTTQLFPDKTEMIVVYCSIGVRSAKIAQQLKDEGYTNVFNLYGGIFEWKNNNFQVFDLKEKETEKVHVYDKDWAIWLIKGEKVY